MGITFQIFRGLAALEPLQNGRERGGAKGFFFFSFSIENRKENGIPKLDSKTVFFFVSSIKTEGVLFFYIYINIYFCIYT